MKIGSLGEPATSSIAPRTSKGSVSFTLPCPTRKWICRQVEVSLNMLYDFQFHHVVEAIISANTLSTFQTLWHYEDVQRYNNLVSSPDPSMRVWE